MTYRNIKHVLEYARHRNGIDGAPFSVAIFEDRHERKSLKLAIVFDAPGHCAVLDIGKLATNDIAFGSNSYRGDTYEDDLRQIIYSFIP